jgi:hypothetical protein
MGRCITSFLCAVVVVAGTPCTVGPDTWLGGSTPITVSAEGTGGSFSASARGAWQDAPGVHFANGTLWLGDCAAPCRGIYGLLSATCDRIEWADGVGSVWTRPRPRKPFNATISNLLPRRDDAGEILRVQDGCLQNFGGVWYLYGARYQCCPVDEQPACYSPCGWRNATFAVYSSPDLETWHLENDNLLPIATDPASPHSNANVAYFEPCALYSKSSDHYALWFLTTNTKAVAVSDSPIGPFESVTWDTGLAQGSDSYFWQDQDDPNGTYYVKHNGPPPPGDTRGTHYVSQLAPDLLSFLPGATSAPMSVPAEPVPPAYQGSWPSCSEGGGMFKHAGKWFVMAAVCCCFCVRPAARARARPAPCPPPLHRRAPNACAKTQHTPPQPKTTAQRGECVCLGQRQRPAGQLLPAKHVGRNGAAGQRDPL